LMVPVMMLTLGRCVAMMRWMPMARASCAKTGDGCFHFATRRHDQVGELVHHQHDVGEEAVARSPGSSGG
jgi:hypothetical protein